MSERWRIPNSKPWITHDDSEAVAYVMGSIAAGEYTLGYDVAAFERELAEFLGRKYVVCVSSGTVALELAYRGRGLAVNKVGAFGFIATANALEPMGEVYFQDRADTATLGEIDGWHDDQLPITDACQAFGAKLPLSLADCYSFNWNKPITCLGGGCVATDSQDIVVEVHALRNQGRPEHDPDAYWAGTNARMSDMQAALGRSQLRRVGEILALRRTVASWYDQNLPLMVPTPAGPRFRDSWFLYPIELSNRDEVHAKMLERGIQTRSCADWLLPAHPYYAERYGYKRGDFPEAERRADRTLLLPLYPEMTLDQVQEVCAALEECDARA